ncbi:RHS repeat-associated protein [Enterobacter sp. BIGb0383]|uniref:RHS repeat-associated core domain-containing protein n=1 Tax=unclassified Enterobacter TaxID=2608935 RepID=UPI000F46B7F0|nr:MULTISPECIES: RHS repeat-associated core domain-containing protein [unclassified Enterobacter]ROP59946.1 RHS repeat-associated protein [Enterobacter sp. BIGb0383]ROS08585.1 RHS repeat-associated protein [Enterobacter sp. BIGb0359]
MLNDIINRVARVGAIHAGNRPNPPTDRPAPGQGKPPTSPKKKIKHKSFLGAMAGAIAGALVAAAVAAVAVALIGVTGGLAIAVVGAVAVFAAGDLISSVSGRVSAMVDSVTPDFGTVDSGSDNVYVEKQRVSRAEVDVVICTKHNSPQLIALGSDSVYVNDHPAARVDDQAVCGATIKEGAATVFFGAGQQKCLDVADEFSWWEKALLIAVEFLVPPSRGLFKGLGKLFIKGPRAVVKGARAGATFIARRAAQKAKCASKAFMKNKGLARVKEAAKAFKKDPVYIASGEVIEQRIDFELGQTLPLVFERTYRTGSAHQGLPGKGWHDSWSEAACVSREGLEETVVITLAGGYDIDFTFHQDQQRVFSPHYPEFVLERREDGFHLWNRDTRSWRAFTVPEGDRRLLSAIYDTHENRIEFIRDRQGFLRHVRHSDGIELTLIWQGEYLQRITRSDGAQNIFLASYTQDDKHQLIEADAIHAWHLYYEYDRAGRLTRWHDNDKTWARYEYDAKGRCVYTTCAGGFLTARFDYLPDRVAMTDGQGQRSEYGFNDLHLMSWAKSPLGHITRYEYDDYGNLLREVSPAGRVVEFSYLEESGLVTTFTDGSGGVWSYDYDENERLCGFSDPLGRSWDWVFDEAGNPEKLTGPDAGEMRFSWNRYGLLTEVSDQAGDVQARLNYDHRRRLLSTTDAEGRTQQLRYDRQDRVVQLQGPDGARFGLGYRRESWKLPEQLIRPDEREERRHYDKHHNLVSYTDGNGALWRQEFGPFDLLVSRTDAEGRCWRYDYDKESQQLTAVIGPDGNRWQWWLDAAGQVVRERDMAGTQTRYEYDEDGLCIAVINGEGESRHFVYDGRGLLLRESSGDESTDYQYDTAGRLTAVTSGENESRFEYDDRDRVVAEWHNEQHIRRAFDDTARTVSRTLQWSEEDAELTSLYRYSKTGELQEVVLPDGAALTLTRDAAGREATRSAGEFARAREYNLMGWLTRESSGQQQDGRLQADQTREYRYDGAGNLKAVRHNRQATGFELDTSGRVLSVFTAGPDRNTTVEERYGYTRSGQPQDAGRLADWQAGRLVQQDDTHYRYDRAGRLVNRQRVQPGFRGQAWHYRWDSRNQLRQLETPDGKRWEYRYDSFGRRISKRCGDEEVRFLWDGDQPAEVRHYRNGECVSRRHWVHNGWELLVQQRQITPEKWETDFVTSDQNGAPQALYGDDGVLRWQPPKATLWGRRTVNDDSPDPGLGFAGQYRDSESGLCYNRFRYYDPDGGCYISPDPIGVLGGESNYGYVHNPVGWVDPFGLAGCPLKNTETYYRSMHPDDFKHLLKTGKLRGTSETFLSPTRAFSEGYKGILVRFDLKSGTTDALKAIGVRDNSKITRAFSDMPFVSTIKDGWKNSYAYFKGERGQLNIGLGTGKALDVFNAGIDKFTKIAEILK